MMRVLVCIAVALLATATIAQKDPLDGDEAYRQQLLFDDGEVDFAQEFLLEDEFGARMSHNIYPCRGWRKYCVELNYNCSSRSHPDAPYGPRSASPARAFSTSPSWATTASFVGSCATHATSSTSPTTGSRLKTAPRPSTSTYT